MKRISLIATLFLAVLILQNCKKDTFIATATTTSILYADINDTTWTPDTLNASITYNSIAKTKVFSFSGQEFNKQVSVSVTQNSGSNTPGFPLGTYTVNNTSNVMMNYFNKQKNSSGNYVFVQQGTVAPGSGQIIVTTVDSVKKVISGTFRFTAKQTNYDSNGNFLSFFSANISSGSFNSMPYTFVSN